MELSCSDHAGAVGKTYTLVAAVDAYADDAADRGTGDLLSPTCGSALADKVQRHSEKEAGVEARTASVLLSIEPAQHI